MRMRRTQHEDIDCYRVFTSCMLAFILNIKGGSRSSASEPWLNVGGPLADADKRSYQNYLDLSLQLVRPGGVIAVDNILYAPVFLPPGL